MQAEDASCHDNTEFTAIFKLRDKNLPTSPVENNLFRATGLVSVSTRTVSLYCWQRIATRHDISNTAYAKRRTSVRLQHVEPRCRRNKASLPPQWPRRTKM